MCAMSVLLGVSLSTTGSTCELNGAYDCVLGIDEFEALEVEVADLHCLAERSEEHTSELQSQR